MAYKILEVCCKAGGAAEGYRRAGFEVDGVDIEPQPHFPKTMKFIQADALQYLNWLIKSGEIKQYSAITGGPPCIFGSRLTQYRFRDRHENLIPAFRELMIASGKYYVIENIEDNRRHLINPLLLCGSMFNIPIRRHRYFENNFGLIMSPFSCDHSRPITYVSGTHVKNGKKIEPLVKDRAAAIGIDWMIDKELDQAIPPVYTEYIGKKLLEVLTWRI